MERIKISGYKSINDIDLELNRINIFFGNNGSGKSNFFSFFELLNNISRFNLQKFVAVNGIDNLLNRSHSYNTKKICAELLFDGDNTIKKYGYNFTLSSESAYDLLFLKEELFATINNENQAFISELKAHESNIDNIYQKIEEESIVDLLKTIPRYLKDYRKYKFYNTFISYTLQGTSNINTDKFFLYEDGRNLAAILYSISCEYPESYDIVIKLIQAVEPSFSGFLFEINSKGIVDLYFRTKYSAIAYNACILPDGLLQFIAIVALFQQPKLPKTIIIEGIDTLLYKNSLLIVKNLIKNASDRGSQIITSINSIWMLSLFKAEDFIYVSKHEDNGTTFSRLSKDAKHEILENYTNDIYNNCFNS